MLLRQAMTLAMFTYVHKAKISSITKWALNSKLIGEGSHTNWVFEDPHQCTVTPVISGTSSENNSKKRQNGEEKEKVEMGMTQQTAEPRPWFLKKECRQINALLNVVQLQSASRKRGHELGRNKAANNSLSEHTRREHAERCRLCNRSNCSMPSGLGRKVVMVPLTTVMWNCFGIGFPTTLILFCLKVAKTLQDTRLLSTLWGRY